MCFTFGGSINNLGSGRFSILVLCDSWRNCFANCIPEVISILEVTSISWTICVGKHGNGPKQLHFGSHLHSWGQFHFLDNCVGKHGSEHKPTPNGMIRIVSLEFLPGWTLVTLWWLIQASCLGQLKTMAASPKMHDSVDSQVKMRNDEKACVLILILILAGNVQYSFIDTHTSLRSNKVEPVKLIIG